MGRGLTDGEGGQHYSNCQYDEGGRSHINQFVNQTKVPTNGMLTDCIEEIRSKHLLNLISFLMPLWSPLPPPDKKYIVVNFCEAPFSHFYLLSIHYRSCSEEMCVCVWAE